MTEDERADLEERRANAAEKQARLTNWLLGVASSLLLLVLVGAFRFEGRMSKMEAIAESILKRLDRIEDKINK